MEDGILKEWKNGFASEWIHFQMYSFLAWYREMGWFNGFKKIFM